MVGPPQFFTRVHQPTNRNCTNDFWQTDSISRTVPACVSKTGIFDVILVQSVHSPHFCLTPWVGRAIVYYCLLVLFRIKYVYGNYVVCRRSRNWWSRWLALRANALLPKLMRCEEPSRSVVTSSCGREPLSLWSMRDRASCFSRGTTKVHGAGRRCGGWGSGVHVFSYAYLGSSAVHL